MDGLSSGGEQPIRLGMSVHISRYICSEGGAGHVNSISTSISTSDTTCRFASSLVPQGAAATAAHFILYW